MIAPETAEGARPEPLRLLVVGPSAPPYNGMSVATESALRVLGNGYDVAHLDTADRRSLDHVGRLDLENIRLGLLHSARFLLMLARFRPQAAYVPIAQSALGFLRDACFLGPCRLLRIPVVVHLHGGRFGAFYQESGWFMKSLIRYCLRHVHGAIVLSSGLRGLFSGILPMERVHVVSNGVDPAISHPTQVRDPARVPTVLYLSTLVESKGFLDLLRAIPMVLQTHPETRFVLAGGWGSASARQRAMDSGLARLPAHKVILAGPQDPAGRARLLENADIFVLPSYDEGQPLAILEAMSASLPVVATPTGAIPETVLHGVNGRLVTPGAPADLAEEIRRLLDNQEEREEMSRMSRRIYLERYTVDHFSQQLHQALALALLSADSPSGVTSSPTRSPHD